MDKANPAAKTATPAFALAIKSKVGAQEVGILIPINTKITASSGAAATGYKVPSDWIDAIAQDTAKNDAKFAKRIKAGETNPEFGYYGTY